MSNDAADLLVGASMDFLRNFSPFNRMEPGALTFLAERAVLAFHARGSEILTPESGVPSHFYIVQRGKIQARQTGQTTVTGTPASPSGRASASRSVAISARRPSTTAYVAVEDSFCFQISADDFLHLMQISPVFHLFCTQYIASLLSQSRQQLQSTFAQRAAEQQTMTTALGKLIEKEAVFVTPDTPTRSALERMSELHLGCIVVVDAARRPVGIVTQSDLLPRGDPRRLRPRAPDRRADDRQPAPVASERVGLRRRARDGHPRGTSATCWWWIRTACCSAWCPSATCSRFNASACARFVPASTARAIPTGSSVRATIIRQLALNLLAQGVGAEQLTQFISALNDALTCRILSLERNRHELGDVDFAWLAFDFTGMVNPDYL